MVAGGVAVLIKFKLALNIKKGVNMKISNHFVCAVFAVSALSGCVSTGDVVSDSSNRKMIQVTQTDRGALITSNERILFDTGKSQIKSEGQVFVDRVARILKEKTKANVSVEGHTDNVGAADLNVKLSESRALAVKQALIKSGVDGKRISAKGFGFAKPLADNGTPEGRQTNRRTDILVIGETVENIGGDSLADKLSEGFAEFVKDPVATFKNAFSN